MLQNNGIVYTHIPSYVCKVETTRIYRQPSKIGKDEMMPKLGFKTSSPWNLGMEYKKQMYTI
jgi:hypothetical protein